MVSSSLALLAAAPGLASIQEGRSKLLASDGDAQEEFGRAVDVSGGVAVVGAPYGDGITAGAGAAYLFDLQTGTESAKLVAADGERGARFGGAVAIDGELAIVGAPQHATLQGAVYVFDTTTGQQLGQLALPPGLGAAFFGSSVDLDGHLAVVGAWGSNDNGSMSGSAFVFDVTTGQQVAKLLPDDGESNDFFGGAVAISGTRVLVGAQNDDDLGVQSGSAYLFDALSGEQLAKLLPASGGTFDRFGAAVALDAELAVVGSQYDHAGSAYLFDVTSGEELVKLTPANGEYTDSFGWDVAVGGGLVLVGMPGHDGVATDVGGAYLYCAESMELIDVLSPLDCAEDDGFGLAVGLGDGDVLVGSYRDDELAEDAGAVYLYAVEAGPDIGASYCGPAQKNSTGGFASISASGSVVAAAQCVTLEAGGLPPGRFAMFLASRDQDLVFPPGSEGFLCLGGAIGRYAEDVQLSGADGSVTLELDLANTPTPAGPVSIQPGETWHFQCWYRDLNPGPTSNFTDGLSIEFE